jgi:hypothetical protein
MPHRTPWDGREAITDALVRYGVRDEFQVAIDSGAGTTAARLLCEVGADIETAWEIIAILVPEPSEPPVG